MDLSSASVLKLITTAGTAHRCGKATISICLLIFHLLQPSSSHPGRPWRMILGVLVRSCRSCFICPVVLCLQEQAYLLPQTRCQAGNLCSVWYSCKQFGMALPFLRAGYFHVFFLCCSALVGSKFSFLNSVVL